ncbi:MAG: septal ring lytic transglycosylase RlpA family protein [Verrucomicrobia bacterium]|nr:septal ring lytic transglycosylase RlpA family protein [Verrucomicrobiota bacterium]
MPSTSRPSAEIQIYAPKPVSVEEGIASWYGGKWIGRLTANGEHYRANDFTAAHKKLPFNTRVRVIHPKTGKSIIVRINNRGPFVKGRIIDLSVEAAKKLGTYDIGLAKVRLEVLRPIPIMTSPNLKTRPSNSTPSPSPSPAPVDEPKPKSKSRKSLSSPTPTTSPTDSQKTKLKKPTNNKSPSPTTKESSKSATATTSIESTTPKTKVKSTKPVASPSPSTSTVESAKPKLKAPAPVISTTPAPETKPQATPAATKVTPPEKS